MDQRIINGRKIAETILNRLSTQTKVLKEKGITPKLVVVLVGNDLPSQTYVRRKEQAAKKCGLDFELVHLPENIQKTDIISKIRSIQAEAQLSGLIVQIPLPEPLYMAEVLNAIDPKYDVDCLTNENLGKLMMNQADWLPPTPGAVMEVLAAQGVPVTGKNVAIVGVGALVGKPMAIIMMNDRASVTTINSITKDFAEKCLAADIIVSGVGKAGLIRGNIVKPNAIVIDTGVSFSNGIMAGDAVLTEIADHAYVTPTPGGVGPITVAKLLANTVTAAARQNNITLPSL